jgi:hypothetical protein
MGKTRNELSFTDERWGVSTKYDRCELSSKVQSVPFYSQKMAKPRQYAVAAVSTGTSGK